MYYTDKAATYYLCCIKFAETYDMVTGKKTGWVIDGQIMPAVLRRVFNFLPWFVLLLSSLTVMQPVWKSTYLQQLTHVYDGLTRTNGGHTCII